MSTRPGGVAPPVRPADATVVALDVPVYTFDIDFAGIVSNIVYLRWSEMWRIEFFQRLGAGVSDALKRGIVPTVVRQELNYRRPMRLGETVRLEGWLEGLGRSSIRLWLEMREAKTGALCCDNRQVLVMVDSKSGASTDLPKELREKLGGMM